MPLTLSEQERAAFMAGDVPLLKAIHQAQDAEASALDKLELQIKHLEAEVRELEAENARLQDQLDSE